MPPLILLTLGFAFLTTLAFVPVVRWVARQVGLIDRPDAERKLHEKPIALGGGVAVFASLLITFAVIVLFDRSSMGPGLLPFLTLRWYALFASAAGMLLLGLVDDAWTLRGRQKLLLQSVIAMSLVGSGTIINEISFFGTRIPLESFAIPVTVLWLLIATNALNLLDGADGMATTVGCFVCGGLALLSFGNFGVSLGGIIALALCGSLAGFLMFNRPPASIFLGDAGSMMIGLVVGVLAIWCSLKESTIVAAGPIAILVLPLFDSSAAIVRRWMTGRSLYATDRGHLHHLLNEKFGPQGMLGVVALLCAFSSLMAYFSVKFGQQWMAPVGGLLVLSILIATRSFGYAEFRLLGGRAWHFVHGFFMPAGRCESSHHHRRVPIQGCGEWDEVWEPLVEFAKKQGLSRVKIDVNMAWLHEGYHATWQSVRLPEKESQSVVRLPLIVERGADNHRIVIGRVEVIATSSPTGYERLAEFMIYASDLQSHVQKIVQQLEAANGRAGSPLTPSETATADAAAKALVLSEESVDAAATATA